MIKKEPRLIKMLRLLDSGEFRHFIDFVKSPFFNKNRKLVKLAEYLYKAFPDFDEKKLKKKKLFLVIFGKEEKYKEQSIHDYFSLLVRLLEMYLAQINFDRDESSKEVALLAELRRKNAKTQFKRIFRRTMESIQTSSIRDTNFYLRLYKAQQEAEAFSGQLKNRDGGQLLQDQVNSLDIFFLSAKLKVSCEMLNRKNIINTAYRSEMEAELNAYLSTEHEYRCIPSITIYHKIYLTLTQPDEEKHFYDLVKTLSENVGQFNRSEAYVMYAYAQNYCIKQINRGKKEFLKELFGLYQQLLQTGILLDSGVLAHEHYKNIITVGLRLKEFEWVETFLNDYKEKLAPEYQENAYNYNLSTIYYEKEQYNEAMKLLYRVQFTDVYYHLSSKSILLKIFYELQEEDSLKYHITAFKAFLKRNKTISGFHSQGHLNLLKYVSKAARIRK